MQFYTVNDLVGMLKVSKSQLYAIIDSGKLKCHRLTTGRQGCIRISQAQLDAYLQETELPSALVAEEEPLRYIK